MYKILSESYKIPLHWFSCLTCVDFVACFSVHVRGSEYIPLLGSSDPSSFLLGVPDIELWSNFNFSLFLSLYYFLGAWYFHLIFPFYCSFPCLKRKGFFSNQKLIMEPDYMSICSLISSILPFLVTMQEEEKGFALLLELMEFLGFA